MNKFQKLKFRNVDDFLDHLPENELKIVELLREIILTEIPDVKEYLAYNVPFYSRHGRICYIWPASVPWGHIKNGVALGFTRANEIIGSEDLLDFGGRKSIGILTFLTSKEIDVDIVRVLLQEAVELDKIKNP